MRKATCIFGVVTSASWYIISNFLAGKKKRISIQKIKKGNQKSVERVKGDFDVNEDIIVSR